MIRLPRSQMIRLARNLQAAKDYLMKTETKTKPRPK